MSDEVRKHLYDILEAIENVDTHLNRERNFNSYMSSLIYS